MKPIGHLQMRHPAPRQRFTLVELFVVIAIIDSNERAMRKVRRRQTTNERQAT